MTSISFSASDIIHSTIAMSTEPLLRVTVCVHRKPGTTEEEFNKYWAYKHGPLATDWLQRNGIIKYTQVSALSFQDVENFC